MFTSRLLLSTSKTIRRACTKVKPIDLRTGQRAESFFSGGYRSFSSVVRGWDYALFPSPEIELPGSGFLRDDFLLIRLEMRVKQEDSESCQISVDGNTAMCEVIPACCFSFQTSFSRFQWQLRYMSEMAPWTIGMERFSIEDSEL